MVGFSGTDSIGGSGAAEFLGTEGDVWDTQLDMFMALVGGVTAQLLLARVLDRQISGIGASGNPSLTAPGSGRTMRT